MFGKDFHSRTHGRWPESPERPRRAPWWQLTETFWLESTDSCCLQARTRVSWGPCVFAGLNCAQRLGGVERRKASKPLVIGVGLGEGR